jgi:hypothetical protein
MLAPARSSHATPLPLQNGLVIRPVKHARQTRLTDREMDRLRCLVTSVTIPGA